MGTIERETRVDPRVAEPVATQAKLVVLALAVAATLTMLASAPVAGQGWIDPRPGVTDWGVVRIGTDVTVRVEGRVAEVVVEEWFENRGGVMGEGDYVYPLPGEAVFSNFSLYQGDQELRGETMDADRARGIYEEIVRRRRDPALIELVGHGLIRARVFPIEPGQRRRITLRYTQVLERTGESVQFRYAAGTRTGGRGALLGESPADRRAATVDFTLLASAEAYGEPFSPTHELDVDRRDGELRVRPEAELAGDFSVFLPVAGNAVGITLATHRPAGEDGYFMLTLSPGEARGEGTPRDVTAVVDVSGSMSGDKIEQTRAALHQLLGSLGRDDRFRLVAFNNRVRVSDDGWSRATPAALRDARRWVDGLQADGGTNIAGALEEALRLSSPDDRLPIVVFLTDGLPTVGEQDPERIAGSAEGSRGRARVFAFGVGYDVNTYLLDRLSAAGRGSTEYVAPGEDVERALATLAGKITHPVLTDLEVAGAPVRLEEIYPGELPDLFAGEELVVFGRYGGADDGRLEIRGRRAGHVERFAVAADFPRVAGANDYIPRLWAARKLGELTRQVRLNGPDPELVESIRETALRYGLLSDYTSYLVQEPMDAVAVTDQAIQQGQHGPPPPAPSPVLTAAASGGSGAALRATSGRVAVEASKRASAQRQVASSAALEMAEADVADELGEGFRVVAGRTFREREDVWVELGPAESPSDTVEIALYSDAYFEVIGALPEVRDAVVELERVTLRGTDVWLRFGEDGESSLSPRELARLVERFRGQ